MGDLEENRAEPQKPKIRLKPLSLILKPERLNETAVESEEDEIENFLRSPTNAFFTFISHNTYLINFTDQNGIVGKLTEERKKVVQNMLRTNHGIFDKIFFSLPTLLTPHQTTSNLFQPFSEAYFRTLSVRERKLLLGCMCGLPGCHGDLSSPVHWCIHMLVKHNMPHARFTEENLRLKDNREIKRRNSK